MDLRLVKLVAVILADGSVDSKRYTISIVEDEAVIKRFVREFREINGLKLNWRLDRQRNSLRARVYSARLLQAIQQIVKEFRTRPYNVHPRSARKKCSGYPVITLPKEFFRNPQIASVFLRYYASCDGGVEFSVYKRKENLIQIQYGIKIGCNNPYLRGGLKKMLELFEIKAIERSDGLRIRRLDDIKKFYEKIGFLKESRVRKGKILKGYSKNDAVKLILLCETLSLKANWINTNFKSIKELEEFLKKSISLIKNNDIKGLKSYINERLKISIDDSNLGFPHPAEIGPVTSGEGVPATLGPAWGRRSQ